MDRFKTVPLTILVCAVFAGCSSTPVAPPATASPIGVTGQASAAGPGQAGTVQPVAASTVATVTVAPHLDPRNLLSAERSVFFEFDDFAIRSDHAALIERHGRYLASKPTLSIKIEGNTDERGSPEYNLALGQRRAESVLRALKIYGVKDSQVEATSWGEERPRATAHNEGAWAQNRRADLAYPQQ